jgi:hypothetical protein
MSRQDDLKKLIASHEGRLQKRKEQKAKFGISADPSIDIEIEDIEGKIEKLQAELAELERSQGLIPQPEPNPESIKSVKTLPPRQPESEPTIDPQTPSP